MKRFILLTFTAVLLVKCGTTTSVMTENYKGKYFEGKKVLVIPLAGDAVTVHNKDDVEDDFENDKRNPEEIVQHCIEQTILLTLNSYLAKTKIMRLDYDSIYFNTCKDAKIFDHIEKRITKDSIRYDFYVPKKEILAEKDMLPDIGIIINKIDFGRNFRQGGGGHFIPGQTVSTPGGSFTTGGMWTSGGGSESLDASFTFIVYDYENEQIISYGEESVGTSFLFGMKRSTWDFVFKAIGRKLVKFLPVTKYPM